MSGACFYDEPDERDMAREELERAVWDITSPAWRVVYKNRAPRVRRQMGRNVTRYEYQVALRLAPQIAAAFGIELGDLAPSIAMFRFDGKR